MTQLVLLLVVATFAISLPLTWIVIGAGRRLGQVDKPDAAGSGGRKDHGRVVPATGGVAIFWSIAGIMLVALGAVWLVPVPETGWGGYAEALRPHIQGLKSQTPMALGVLGAMLVMHITGLVDDRKGMGPMLKLGIQIAVAVALATFVEMRIFEFLGDRFGLAGTVASIVLSVLWIGVVCNAMNFMDNMDGLSGGVGCICASLYLAATLIGGQWFVAAMAAMLVGALLGFLVFNFPPAKVFMGDGGSLVLGLLLALISMRTTYFAPEAATRPGAWYGVLMPLMVLAVPLYDFTSVTLIRISQGRSPFQGDQQHFSHRLVKKGMSKPVAVMVIWLCTLATGLSGVMLGSLSAWQACIAAAQTVAVLLVLAMIEQAGRGKAQN